MYESLNEAQRQAVTSLEGPVLIIAGPGAGKTRTLAFRIAYMIDSGIDPSNILAITFTNKAAKEMRERVESLLPDNSVPLVTTLHSLGLRIIRESFPDEFLVYDRADQINIVKNILNCSFSAAQKSVEKISRFKNRLEEPDSAGLELLHDYVSYLQKHNAIDFDDMVLKPLEALKEPSNLKKYNNRFRYILADEYQDIDLMQYKLLKLLAGPEGNICAVGDPDQAVYAFRGANLENFMIFQRDFPSARVIFLTRNYRSTNTILGASNYLISNNARRISRQLHASKHSDRRIAVISVQDENAEGAIIIREIEKRVGGTSSYQHYRGTNPHDSGDYSFSDFAVLTRTNAQLRTIEESFIKSGIPYQAIASTHFLDRQEIRDAAAYCRVIINPSDDLNLSKIINRPSRGIGAATLSMIADYASGKGLSLYHAMRAGAGLDIQKKGIVKEFVAFIEDLIELKNTANAETVINRIIEKTGLKEFYPGKEDSFLELQNVASAYSQYAPPFSFMNFISDIVMMKPNDMYDPVADKVAIMTMHMAKGLEFRTVFVTGVEAGLIPFEFRDDTDTEEERRLFYVAMTRAKDELFLLSSRSRFIYGRKLSGMPSSFISEIPSEHLNQTLIPDRIHRKKQEPQMGLF